ncbi:hypothetical protein [Dictyobacter kobayashii]|uniref:Uncharacterized protein n=1 Tax=Dictyobacter kobayashii TaxID=2014872 RepID=A0A402AFC0_9CHLR|nr:hypothetical protein [Dictyobacter kobayashii]GCE17799.1 hypothetical protein KDK_15990 [Dictyobacter kobayashii]
MAQSIAFTEKATAISGFVRLGEQAQHVVVTTGEGESFIIFQRGIHFLWATLRM